jgi:hypothetical protein
MESKDLAKNVFLGALIILFFAVSFILFKNITIQNQDTTTLQESELIDEFDEVSTSYRLLEYLYETNDSCEILTNQLLYLENRLWMLGNTIEDYKTLHPDFENDYSYLSGKRRVNRWEVTHFSMLSKVKKKCDLNHTILLYFYGECSKNKQCNEQGLELDKLHTATGGNMSIFSFDYDLNTSAVNSLMQLYNVTALPCVVIEGNTQCGFIKEDDLISLLCKYSPYQPVCAAKT